MRIRCAECQKKISIDDAFAGGVCRCPHCKALVVVPAAEAVAVSDRPDFPAVRPEPPTPVRPDAPPGADSEPLPVGPLAEAPRAGPPPPTGLSRAVQIAFLVAAILAGLASIVMLLLALSGQVRPIAADASAGAISERVPAAIAADDRARPIVRHGRHDLAAKERIKQPCP